MALEFLQVAENVAREKDIEKDQVLEAMEEAIQMAARRKYGMGLNVQAHIDREDGEVAVKKLREVVGQVMEPISPEELRMATREGREPKMQPAYNHKGMPLEENDSQVLFSKAMEENPDVEIGEFLMEDLPPFDFGRVAAQAAKQVIFQKVRDAERGRQFEEYKDLAGTVAQGIVKRIDHNGVLVDLGGAEAFIPREETIQREQFKQNDRVRGYIYKVERQQRGPQIWISRTHPNFLIELFKEEVPEIENGTIEIIGAARDAGFRAKMAVKSYDANMDPVGACVGIRGVRVQAITDELQGERIDIIQYNEDPAQFLIKAMAPAEVTKVVMDEEGHRMEVVVPEDKLSLAIGRRGQNVRLASILTGWDIDVMSEAEESERRQQEFDAASSHFIEALDVDDMLAQLLISEGFHSAEQLLQVEASELTSIEGFTDEIAEELQNRAKAYVQKAEKELKDLGVEKALEELEGMRTDVLVAVAKQGVKTLDDLADLATDELLEMLPAGSLKAKEAEELIMGARQHWFEGEDEASA